MGGFYGNISHSNKTAIQFDKIYHTRVEMDATASSDGIFIGRYVLIDYDEPAISGYYKNQKFYTSDVITTSTTEITGVAGAVYLDLISNVYYTYNTTTRKFVAVTVNAETGEYGSPYVQYYNTDIRQYGRGYDSTAWVKTYANNTYKYVMVAELNTVVPNFHLVAEIPADAPIPPYFDSNVTNLDYYMHVQSGMINTINSTTAANSDEEVGVVNIAYGTDSTGHPTYSAQNGTITGDIFYNKAGFNVSTRTYNTGITNSLNFDTANSGRIYGKTPMTNGQTAPDIHKWHIRFPAIGNMICTAWDTLYSKDSTRKRAFLKEDSTSIILEPDGTTTAGTSSSYTTSANSVLGIINNARQRIGLVQALGSLSETTPSNANNDSNIVRYKDANSQRTYYMPQYANTWTAAGTAGNPTGGNGAIYYIKVGNVYKKANLAALASNTAVYTRTSSANSKPYLVWKSIYTGSNTTGDSGANAVSADSDTTGKNFGTINGAVAYVHKIMGSHLREEDSRDDRTVIGLMNQMKDLIANVDTLITPKRFIVSNDNGQMTSGTLKLVLSAQSSAVTGLSTNSAQITCNVIDPVSTGISIGTSNKWICMNLNASTQKFTIAHALSNGITANSEYATTASGWGSASSNNDNIITLPTFTFDEAGHLIETSTVSFYLPHSFKTFALSQSSAVTELTTNTTSIVADTSADTFTFAAANKWIRFASNADTLRVAHAISSNISANSEYATTATGWNTTTDNIITLPTFTFDEAGHLIASSTVSFYLPHSFKTFKTSQSTNHTDLTANSTANGIIADSSADTFTFATYNKWLVLSENTSTDTLTIAHKLMESSDMQAHFNANNAYLTEHPALLSTAATIIELGPTLIAGNADNTDSTLRIPSYSFDKAGHLVEYNLKTFTLPNAFKVYSISKDSTAVTNGAGNSDNITIKADNASDTLTIAPSNKWIRLNGNSTSDTITIGHQVNEITATTPTIDFNNNGTFTSDEFTYDEAGHITARVKTTYTLPYNYKTISVTNSDAVTDVTSSNGSIVAGNQVAEATFVAGNKWIKFVPNNTNQTITVAHALSTLSATTIEPTIDSALSSEIGAAIILPTFATDNAGHIISASSVTYYVPYTFKTVTVDAQSTIDSGSLNTNGVTTSIVANSMTDTLKFATANKWIRVTGYDNTDTISIGHYVNDITVTTTNYSFNGESRDFDPDFTVNLVTFDAAGHITGQNVNGYKLPHGFKTISLKASENSSNDMTAPIANIDCVAGNMIDTFNIIDGNKWIVLNLDASNNELSIGHKYSGVNSGSYGLSAAITNTNSFDIPYITVDSAGHITSVTNSTVTLPNNFTTINVSNGISVSSITPANMTSTLGFAPNDTWITMGIVDTNVVSIGHKIIHNEDISNKGTAASPTSQFGMEFKVPYLSIDTRGHVTALTDTIITIPTGSLINTDSGNVLTNASYDNTTGALTVNKSYVGSLLLNGYSLGTDANAIAASDSINSAFSKLSVQIAAEISNRETAVSGEASARDTAIGNAISTEVTNRDTAISTAIGTEVTNRNTAIDTAITALNIPTLTQRVNDVEIANGGLDNRIDDLEVTINGDDLNNINGLVDRVETLEDIDINTLIDAKITALFANYEFELKAPIISVDEENGVFTITLSGVDENDAIGYQWQREGTNPGEFEDIIDAINNSYDTENIAGKYQCVITRVRNGHTKIVTTEVQEIE